MIKSVITSMFAVALAACSQPAVEEVVDQPATQPVVETPPPSELVATPPENPVKVP